MSKFFKERPPKFFSKTSVATCFIEWNNKLLFLKRSHKEIAPNLWAIPGGKLENFESSREAVLREIYEETNIDLSKENLNYFGKFYVSHSIMDYELHLYKSMICKFPLDLKINFSEHSEYIWKSIETIQELNLIDGQLEAFNIVYKSCMSK